MRKTSPRHIEVYAHWETLSQPTQMGTLNATPARGKEIFSFTYNNDWLRSNQAHMLDPSLQLFQGPQYAPYEQKNFSVFSFVLKVLGLHPEFLKVQSHH